MMSKKLFVEDVMILAVAGFLAGVVTALFWFPGTGLVGFGVKAAVAVAGIGLVIFDKVNSVEEAESHTSSV